MGLFDFILGNRNASDDEKKKHNSKQCKQILGKIKRKMERSEGVLLRKINKLELSTVEFLIADNKEDAKSQVLQIVGLRRKLAFNRDAIHFCAAISPCSDALFSSKSCPQDLETPVANLVYASTRRSDVPQLSAFRDLIQKNYKLGEGFLKFPGNTYARGTKITPEVYTALQLAHPNDKQIQILFDHICLKHGAIYWKGFSSGLMHQLGQIEKNLYR